MWAGSTPRARVLALTADHGMNDKYRAGRRRPT